METLAEAPNHEILRIKNLIQALAILLMKKMGVIEKETDYVENGHRDAFELWISGALIVGNIEWDVQKAAVRTATIG